MSKPSEWAMGRASALLTGGDGTHYGRVCDIALALDTAREEGHRAFAKCRDQNKRLRAENERLRGLLAEAREVVADRADGYRSPKDIHLLARICQALNPAPDGAKE